MCGILAVIGKHRYKEIPQALIERGRDSQGIYENEHVQLIQTRLEITKCDIELPYQNDRYVLLFNGEIFNWQELGGSNEYESILKAYSTDKDKLREVLDGQYFILIYDKETNRISIFNDEFKINAAYYTYYDESMIISSNIASLPVINYNKFSKKGYGNISTAKVL